MIDKFVLLTPLIILPILLLFAFVGCGLHSGGLDIQGPLAQATLIYPPNALTSQNATSLTVKFTLTWTEAQKFVQPIPSVPPSKTVLPLPNKAQDQIELNWGPGGVNDLPPWTITCHVDLASSPPFVTVINNDATKMIQGGSINATFQLLAGPSNSFTLVAL
jgi:hypothetical protein